MARRAGVLDKGGLRAAHSALRAIDKELPKQGRQILVEAGVETAARVNASIAFDPVLEGRALVKPIKRQSDAGVFASRTARTPVLHSFEYGAKWHKIPVYRGRGQGGSKARPQKSMRRRVLPTPVSHTRNSVGVPDGHHVAPTMARMAPKIDRDMLEKLTRMMNRELDKRGIPRG